MEAWSTQLPVPVGKRGLLVPVPVPVAAQAEETASGCSEPASGPVRSLRDPALPVDPDRHPVLRVLGDHGGGTGTWPLIRSNVPIQGHHRPLVVCVLKLLPVIRQLESLQQASTGTRVHL